MVRIDRVHTGGGDSGESSLVDGSRRSKSDARFSVVGDCDELNSLLGVRDAFISFVILHYQESNTNFLILEQNLLVPPKTFQSIWFSSMKINRKSWYRIWMRG